MRIAVTGATGFIGKRVVERLLARGDDVVAITRELDRARPLLPSSVALVAWEELEQGLGEVDAAINLAGDPVVGRWTEAKKARVKGSRVDGTKRLVAALHKTRARVLVSASAVGYYGPHGDEELDEDSPAGSDFLAGVCQAWETEARAFAGAARRTVCVRTGVVLGKGGGALAQMVTPFKMFAGGPVGSGKQWTSWIHLDDLASLYLFALDDARAQGTFNGTAPNPTTMKELAKALGRALHRPSWLPVPAAAVRTMFGEGATVVLDGQRVLPKRPLALGFQFRFANLDEAMADLFAG
jgi:uncharacterized protein (TIGR01777 family)